MIFYCCRNFIQFYYFFSGVTMREKKGGALQKLKKRLSHSFGRLSKSFCYTFNFNWKRNYYKGVSHEEYYIQTLTEYEEYSKPEYSIVATSIWLILFLRKVLVSNTSKILLREFRNCFFDLLRNQVPQSLHFRFLFHKLYIPSINFITQNDE